MSYATFARKNSEASTEKTRLANCAVSSNLRVGDSNDEYEREADRVAEALLSDRRPPAWSLSKISMGQVQRQTGPTGPGNQPTPQSNNYEEAAKKLGEAFLKTDLGKKLTDATLNDPLVKGAEGFIGTLSGKVIAGAAAVGAVTALAATHKELPAQIPEIPLDKIRPGLSVQITYEGPVDKPTKAIITFSYTPKGEEKKPQQTESERYRAERAGIVAEQQKFRTGMKYKPGSAEDLQQKAEQKMMEEWMARRFGALPGTPGGAPLGKAFPALQSSSNTGLRMPAFQSPFPPNPFHVLDQQLELKPLTSSNAPAAEEKKKEEPAPIQRKAAGGMAAGTHTPAAMHEVLHSCGTSIDGETQRLMQSRIGFDFSHVRVHTDGRAAASAQAINATAYTVGSDIVFAPGHYSPHSTEGRRLLAHELAHTVQQREHAAVRAGGLPISGDATAEREADHAAERIVTGHRLGQLTTLTARVLQRKCACGGSGAATGECEECKKKKEEQEVLQRKIAGTAEPGFAPPIVQEVLNSPGQPLDRASREYFEPHFETDFSRVKVHIDARASESANSMHAHAYTVGDSIVFAADRYRPDTKEGRHLLAHELTHVMHQRSGATNRVQREDIDESELVPAQKTGALIERAFDAADSKHWEEAAELANGLSPGELRIYIQTLKNPALIDQLHIGALLNPRVGPNSAVAKATSYTHLNMHYAEELRKGHYQTAAEYLNGFSSDEIKKRLKTLKTSELSSLHQGAVENKSLGADSAAAKLTAEELNTRSTQGDTAAVDKPERKLTPREEKEKCQQSGAKGKKIFPLRMPRGMWRISVAPVHAERAGNEILVSQPLNAVYADQTFRREARTLPLQTFTGGIHLSPNEVVGVRVYDDNEKLICVTGEEMLQISEATDTATLLSVVQTAVEAATIMLPGAGAGASRATQLAIGAAPVLANTGIEIARQESLVSHGLQDEVDWGGVAFDAVFQLVTVGFGGKLTDAAVEAILGETQAVARPFLKLAVETVISGAINDVQVVAHALFEVLRKKNQKMTYQEFLVELAKQFATGVLLHAVMTTAQHEQGGGPHTDEPILGNKGAGSQSKVRETDSAQFGSAESKAGQGAQKDNAPKGVDTAQADRQSQAGGAAGKDADVINLAAERQKRAAAAKARAREAGAQRKLAAGAERELVVAKFSDEDIASHISEETQHKGPGDRFNPKDVGEKNIRKTRTVRTTEYDPWVGDSGLLGERLGRSPGPGYQAHHIVPGGEPRAAALRDFLRQRGWKDINDPDNGVWLPTGSQTENVGAEYKHEFTFDAAHLNDEYFQRLEDVLMRNPNITPSGIRLKLRGIRKYLKEGQLPPEGM